ncbi:MAG TPA: hypothetical protein VIL04_02320, partial [Solirubrobacterales bacterium]
GVAYTEYRVNGGDWVVSENTEGDDPFVTEFTVDDPGAYTVEYRSADAAGNVEEAKSVSFEIEEEEQPVGEPALSVSANPKKKTVRRKAKRVGFNVRVSNTGDGAAAGVRVCAKAPKKKIRVLGKACQSVGKLAAQAKSAKLRFQVKPKKKAAGKKTRIKFVVTAKNADRAVATVNLRVRRN